MEYRVPLEKDGIKVEMVVTVNSKVQVGFLITNNRGGCYVDIRYYDTLGNTKTISVHTAKGDLNKSTGVVLEFPKPNTSFDACFEIVKISDCDPYPKPVIVQVEQQYIREWYCDWFECYPVWDSAVLWENGNQKVIPVFPAKDGLKVLLGYRRDKTYWFPISAVKLFLKCFAGGYQWAVVSLMTSIDDWCIDCYTDITVYPEGGYYTVTSRKHRSYYEDFYFRTYDRSVSVVQKGTIDNITVYSNECKEVQIPADCRIISSVVDGQHSDACTRIYHNGNLIYEKCGHVSMPYLLVFIGNFKAGDKLKFCYYRPSYSFWRAMDIKLWDYSFNEVFNNIILRAFKSGSGYEHVATIKAVCVAEEFIDEYIGWLKSKGYNVVKINPSGTYST